MSGSREDGAYLDWAATAPLLPRAHQAMEPWLSGLFGNPSSLHAWGKRARLAVQEAREQVATLIGASPSSIVFTSGATEADNLALRGAAWAARHDHGRRHLLASTIEHAAVRRTLERLEREGFEVEGIPVSASGVVSVAEVARRVRPDTALVSVMAVSNEVGTVQPIAEIAGLAREVGALVHCDAVQAAPWATVDVTSWGVDLLCLSAHKMGGPQGAGALYVRDGLSLVAQILGGEQENQRRAGTENVAACVGFGVAAEEARASRDERVAHLRHLERRLVEGVLARVPQASRLGAEGALAPTIACLIFPQVDAETLLFALDMAGVAASSGSACSSRSLEPSPVLLAMGFERAQASSTIRFSWGASTREREIDRLLDVLPGLVAQNLAARSLAGRLPS